MNFKTLKPVLLSVFVISMSLAIISQAILNITLNQQSFAKTSKETRYCYDVVDQSLIKDTTCPATNKADCENLRNAFSQSGHEVSKNCYKFPSSK